MNPSIVNIFLGFLLVVGSLLAAKRIEKHWGKIIVVVLGLILAGIIAFFPSVINLLNAPSIPSDAVILSLLYGEGVPIQDGLAGNPVYIAEQLSASAREQFNHAAQVNTQVVYKEAGWDHNPQSLIVLTRTGPPDCCDRSLIPVLGGAVITWNEDAWQVIAYQKWITPFDGFNLLSEGKFIEIGPEKMGLLLPEKTQSGGVHQTWDLLLSEMDGSLKLVAKIETGANNLDQCSLASANIPCWEYKSTYEFAPGNHVEYYEIQIITSGSKLVDDLLVPFEETSTLGFSDIDLRFEIR